MEIVQSALPSQPSVSAESAKPLALGQVMHGFKVERVIDAPITGGTSYLLRHERLGTEVVFNHCADTNKTFLLDFETPGTSDNGSNHVLEHLVLAGSRDFPLKAPFFFALLGSFNTYQNAWTSVEHTAYPFGTTNHQEYRNLLALYLDSAFNPLLRESAFRQEGFRFKMEPQPDGRSVPAFDGVVYNEMKGGMSDPSNRLYLESLKALCPDSHLRFNTGGDPDVIPEITLEKLREYHRTYYHPSAARIVLHGDLDIEPVLGDLAKRFEQFEYQTPAAKFQIQPAFDAPRHVTAPYAAKDPASPAYQSLTWTVGEQKTLTDYFAWDLLESILVKEPSSPLKQAIMKSELCGGIEGSGFFGFVRQTMFHVSLAGVERKNLDAIAEVVHTELRRIVKEGLPREQIEASLNAYEFKLRERYSDEPQGLALSNHILTASKQSGEPLDGLRCVEHIQALRQRLEENPRYFESLIEKFLVSNPHQARVDLLPDTEFEKQFIARAEASAAARARELGPEGIEIEERKNADMKAWVASKDTPEDAAKVPCLRISDIPTELPATPELRLAHGPGTVLLHDMPTGGIMYANIAFDLSRVPERLIPYAPFFAELLGQIDTGRTDYTTLSRRIDRETGGIDCNAVSRPSADGTSEKLIFTVSGRALEGSSGNLMSILDEILHGSKLDDKKRILEIAKEKYESARLALVEEGHAMAINSALAALHPAYAHRDILSGPRQARFARDLPKRISKSWSTVRADLLEFRDALFNNTAVVAMAGDPSTASVRENLARATLDRLNAAPPMPDPQPFVPDARELNLGVDSSVNYIAKAAVLGGDWREQVGPLLAAQRIFGYDVAVPKIRVEGNAYSANAIFHPQTGVFALYTYRDPKIAESLAVFDSAPEYFSKLEINAVDLTRRIVGAAAAIAPFELPRDAALESLYRYVIGASPEIRQQRYGSLVRATPEKMKLVGEYFAGLSDRAVTRILGSEIGFKKAGLPFETAL